MQFDRFDWDDGNREKCRKHGVSIEEIEEALRMISFIIDDLFPGGKRYRTVGKTRQGWYVFAVFTLRGSRLRPISVRYMHEREVKHYEEAMARLAER